MRKLLLLLFLLILAVLIVGLGIAAFWDMEPPDQPMEVPIPHERLSL